MKAKYVKNESLPKGEIWKLDNGWKAWVEHTWQGIPFVSKLISPDRKQYWHCSSGLNFRETYSHMPEVIEVFENTGQISLPDFAKPFAGKVKDFNDKPIRNLVKVFFNQ